MNSLYRFLLKRKIASVFLFLFAFIFLSSRNLLSQPNRIHYAGKDLFINGINIAWVNFAGDLGPNPPDLAQFQTEFQTVHSYGGNVMRFWLHTNGNNTPSFNADGFVTGPGPLAIQNLKQILDLAEQNDIGLILCLWSHDMLNQSQMDTSKLHRNARILTDTSYTNSYIRNALIPMVDSVKGHPAIVAWEILNEPEGITNEYGWSGRDHVPIQAIQQFINLTSGAIHRTAPDAFVTSGAVSFLTLTDISSLAKAQKRVLSKINTLSIIERKKMTEEFNAKHRLQLSSQEYIDYLNKTLAAANLNYYRDDRLIAIGGDTAGTLDFYCVHYYATHGAAVSPFIHTASYWELTKPIVAAEFYMQATDGVPGLKLYPWLYDNGYAGGMAWSWTDFGSPVTNSKEDTWTSLQNIFDNHRNDVIINPKTGTIYKFKASQTTIEKTDSAKLQWDVEVGSTVTLNGSPVQVLDSIVVAPLVNTKYTMIATGEVTDTSIIDVSVLPTGKIITFKAKPLRIGTDESTTLLWHVVKGSTVTLNSNPVQVIDTTEIFPTATNKTFTLVSHGDINDSLTLSIQIFPPEQVNRAYGADVIVSSNDTVTYSFSKPGNIVDGNNISRWQAAALPVGQSVQLDLGKADTIKKIIIRWGNKAFAKQFSVQASKDLVNWSVIKSVLNGTGGTNYIDTLDNLSGIGRYLAFLLQSQGSGAYSIAEIYVYGAPANITNVDIDSNGLPNSYSLFQNYPNPFNPTTTINFVLPKESFVTLTIYNLLGQKVATLVDTYMEAGKKSVVFNANGLASGIYLYRLQAGDYLSNKKMLLIK